MPERLTKQDQMRIDHPWGPETEEERIANAAEGISRDSVRDKYLRIAEMMKKRRLNPVQFENGRLFPDE